MSRKQTPLCLLCTIVERGGGQRAFRTSKSTASPCTTASAARAPHLRICWTCWASALPNATSSSAPFAQRSAVDGWWKKSTGTAPTCGPRAFLFVLPLTAASAIAGGPAGRPQMQRRELPWSRTPKTEHDSGGRKSGLHRSCDGHRQSRRRPGRHRNPQPHPAQRRTRLLRRPHRSPANANCWSSWPPARASATPSWKASTKPTAASRQPMPFSTHAHRADGAHFLKQNDQGEPKRFPLSCFPPSAAASRRKIPFSCELLPKGLHPIC